MQFRHFHARVRTADGGFSDSVFQDKAGADESMKKAEDGLGHMGQPQEREPLRLQRDQSFYTHTSGFLV
jgi:hypothetical protein